VGGGSQEKGKKRQHLPGRGKEDNSGRGVLSPIYEEALNEKISFTPGGDKRGVAGQNRVGRSRGVPQILARKEETQSRRRKGLKRT